MQGPRDLKLRPTSDRLRETLFNILGGMVEGAVFVDVHAGTGAVGIEALSRGAREVIFIEKHKPTVALIRKNLATLGVKNNAQVIAADAVRGMEHIARQGTYANVIFLDPPYEDYDQYKRCLEWLGEHSLLAEGGCVVVEHLRKLELPQRVCKLERVRVVEQGDSTLSFYREAK